MLRVTIEIVPFGDEDSARKIGEMVIANDTGDVNSGTGSYQVWTAPDSWSKTSAQFARLNDFDRRKSPWELVMLLLECIHHEKHAPDLDEDSISQRLFKRLGLK